MILRKLTRKSLMTFGKYRDLTVQDVLNTDRGHLIWVYYNSSNIDFFPDILDELIIKKEFRIAKPGKNPGMKAIMIEATKDEFHDNRTDAERGMARKNSAFKKRKQKAIAIQNVQRRTSALNNAQRNNSGLKKSIGTMR